MGTSCSAISETAVINYYINPDVKCSDINHPNVTIVYLIMFKGEQSSLIVEHVHIQITNEDNISTKPYTLSKSTKNKLRNAIHRVINAQKITEINLPTELLDGDYKTKKVHKYDWMLHDCLEKAKNAQKSEINAIDVKDLTSEISKTVH
jgi:hypothetical protein